MSNEPVMATEIEEKDPGTIAIPYKQILVTSKHQRTTAVRYAPVYEVPLLQKQWENKGTIEVKDLPKYTPSKSWRGIKNAPLPDNMKGLFIGGTDQPASVAELKELEKQRLSRLYSRGPVPGMTLFDMVYPVTTFSDAFDKAADGAIQEAAPEPKPKATKVRTKRKKTEEAKVEEETQNSDDPVVLLQKINEVGPENAEALVSIGIETIAEVAEMSVEELEAIQGIGSITAKQILESASALALEG